MSGGQVVILVTMIMMMVAWVLTSWIRARHGYPLEDWSGMGCSSEPKADRQVEQLTSENSQLKNQVTRLEDRIAVLERIATDPAERTAREIDALR